MSQILKKSLLFIIEYWVIFVGIPFVILLSAGDKQYLFDWPGYVMFYILFIAPFLYVLPYLLVRKILINKKQKFYFVFFGLILPYLLILFSVYQAIRYAFNHSSFPF